jgi:peptide/nickel transport system substrate-binding protein
VEYIDGLARQGPRPDREGTTTEIRRLLAPGALVAGLPAAFAVLPAGARTIRLGTDVDAGTLDLRAMRDTTACRVNDLLHDGLVQRDAGQRPVPDLAERWENPEPEL